MRATRRQTLLLSALSACLPSGCFLAGYDQHPPEGMDAGDAYVEPAPDAATMEAGNDAADLRDGGSDAGAKDAAVDALADAAVHDAGVADASADADTVGPPDTGTLPAPDASVDGLDAGSDAALAPDAADAREVDLDGSTGSDAGYFPSETSVVDAGTDACGPSGCVVTQTCADSECDLACNEAPDPGSEISLDCRFECPGGNRCASACSYGNTCLTNCVGTNVCRATCPLGAVCSTHCTTVANCGGTCNTGSTCLFTCTASTCNQVVCALGAACRIRCTTSSCDFAFCGNVIASSCADGSIVCGRLCP